MADLVNAYITVEQLRDVMRDQLTAHDDEYARAILAASRQIDDYCGRYFYQDAAVSAKVFKPNQVDLLWTPDISTTTGLIVKTDDDGDGVYETTWTLDTDFIMEPFERMNGRPYERIAALETKQFPVAGLNVITPVSSSMLQTTRSRRPRVQVTARWGWPAIPSEVIQGAVIASVDHFKAKDLTHVTATYGIDVRVARDATPGNFGRSIKFNRLRAPSLNPEVEALVSSLRVTVLA